MERDRAVDAVVVGAGVIGCAIAWALARRGASVSVVERDQVGEHASRAAAGMLAPLTESGGSGPIASLGLRSLALFPTWAGELAELSGIDPGYRASGILRVAFAGEAREIRARARALAPHGAEWLDADGLAKREPRAAGELVGALWSPREAHVDAALLTAALAAAARRRGARFVTGAEVLGLERSGGRVTGVRTADGPVRAAEVVLATGAWAARAADWAGLPVPVEPVKGQMVALAAPGPNLPAIVWGRGAYLVPRADGTLAIGATVERRGFDARPTAEGTGRLVAAATELVPALGDCAFLRAWAGLRPGTPDELPLVGPVPGGAGLTLAVGHYRNGVLLAPLTGELVARWLLERELDPALAPLAPGRFGSA